MLHELELLQMSLQSKKKKMKTLFVTLQFRTVKSFLCVSYVKTLGF